jgi:hypothetical protein
VAGVFARRRSKLKLDGLDERVVGDGNDPRPRIALDRSEGVQLLREDVCQPDFLGQDSRASLIQGFVDPNEAAGGAPTDPSRDAPGVGRRASTGRPRGPSAGRRRLRRMAADIETGRIRPGRPSSSDSPDPLRVTLLTSTPKPQQGPVLPNVTEHERYAVRDRLDVVGLCQRSMIPDLRRHPRG